MNSSVQSPINTTIDNTRPVDKKCSQRRAKDSLLPLTASTTMPPQQMNSYSQTVQELKDNIAEYDINTLTSLLQEAAQTFQELKAKFIENTKKLIYAIELVKKELPSVLESPPPIVSQALEEIKKNQHLCEEQDFITEKDLGLVQTMKILIKEFNSYIYVLETLPEAALIKESMMRELRHREEAFKDNLFKFKQNKPWLIYEGLKDMEDEYQLFIRHRYQMYIQTLDLKLESMSQKMKALDHAQQDRETQSQSNRQMSNSNGVMEDQGGSETADMSCSSSSSASNSDDVEQENYTIICNRDEIINVHKKRSNDNRQAVNCHKKKKYEQQPAVKTKQKSRPEGSLPNLDDLFNDESLEDSTIMSQSSHVSSASTKEQTIVTDNFVETLLTEVEQEMETDAYKNAGAEQEMETDVDKIVGAHFLTPPCASVTNLNPSKQEHNTSVLDKSENVCPKCQQQFENKKSMYLHKLHNHVSRICNLCTEIFENVTALTDHVSKIHTAYKVCLVCYEVVETLLMSKHASNHPQSNESEEEKFKCRVCFKVFNSMDEVKIHEKEDKNHRNDFHVCILCTDLFLSRYDLHKHTCEQHLAVKANICKVCFSYFGEKDSLLKHVKLAHNMIKNKSPKKYLCICCYQENKSSVELIRHMKECHQNSDLVERASKGESSGFVKNKCSHCSLYFKNCKVRAVHEIVFHESPPYKCACNMAFFTKAKLDEHILKHTKIEEKNMKINMKKRSQGKSLTASH